MRCSRSSRSRSSACGGRSWGRRRSRRRTAILSWDLAQKQAVLYALEGETARKRTVTTGATSGDEVEIVSGLAKGDRVVTRGGFNLRDGDSVEVVKPEASPASEAKRS